MELDLKKLDRLKNEFIYIDDDVKMYGDQLESIFDQREIKLLLLFDRDLNSKNDIKISEGLREKLNNTDKEIKVKFGNITLFNGRLVSGLINVEGYDISCLISYTSDKENNKAQFKIYYDQLYNWFKYNSKSKASNKYSAMMTYLSVKDYLKKYHVSKPNCFIENCGQEFDMLLLNENYSNKNEGEDENKNEYVYKKENVLAVVELKTSGVMYKKEVFKTQVLKNMIIKYILHISNVNISQDEYEEFEKIKEYEKLKNWFKVFLNKAKISKKEVPPFIYLTLHQSNRKTKYVEEFQKVFNDYNKMKSENLPEFYSIFITVKENNEMFAIKTENSNNIINIIEKLK